MQTKKAVSFQWKHDGHELSFDASSKDSLFYLRVKEPSSKDHGHCYAVSRGKLRGIAELIDKALADVAAELPGEESKG